MRAAGTALWWTLALVALLACGGGDAGLRRTPSAPSNGAPASPTSVAPASDPATTVEQAIEACRGKDAERLRSLVAAPVTAGEVEALFARGSDVLLRRRVPAVVDGDSAVVEVHLEIHRDGDADEVDRSWELERGDDRVWRLTELPDCY